MTENIEWRVHYAIPKPNPEEGWMGKDLIFPSKEEALNFASTINYDVTILVDGFYLEKIPDPVYGERQRVRIKASVYGRPESSRDIICKWTDTNLRIINEPGNSDTKSEFPH